MPKRLLFLALIALGCSDSGRSDRDAAPTDSGSRAVARAIPAAAFRVAAHGGGLAVYSLPTLDSTPWGSGSRVSGAREAIGVDLVGRRLLFRDTTGAVASFDLVSLRQRTVAPRHASAAIGADGTLLTADSFGVVVESQPWGLRSWPDSLGRGVRAVFAATGSRLMAIRRTRAGDSLQLSGRENGVALQELVPASADVAVSRDGDALAFATDSGAVVYEDRDMRRPWFVRLAGTPSAVLFSPSGHRLYVALGQKNEIAVVDRFSQRERGTIALPGPAALLRNDPWGRVLLARGGTNDASGETWVVSVADGDVAGRLHGPWASDLPAVSQSGIMLSREGNAVVARDIRSLDSLGAVAGAASDVWFAGRWVPSSASAAARAAVTARGADGRRPTADGPTGPAAQAPVTRGTTPRPATTPPARATGQAEALSGPERAPAPAAARPNAPQATLTPQPAAAAPAVSAFYAQLLATRSEDAARSMAALFQGQQVLVVAPRAGLGDDNWRVMAGPFRSREAADSAGRSLGRPYWVVDRTRDPVPRP